MYMEQWNYITIRQAKTKQNTDFMVCSNIGELLTVTDCHGQLRNKNRNKDNITMYKMTTM